MSLNMHTTPRNNELKEIIRETRYTTKKDFISNEVKKMMDLDIIRDLANKAMMIDSTLSYEDATKQARREYLGEEYVEELELTDNIELPSIEIEEASNDEELLNEGPEQTLDENMFNDIVSNLNNPEVETTPIMEEVIAPAPKKVEEQQIFDPESLFAGLTDDITLKLPEDGYLIKEEIVEEEPTQVIEKIEDETVENTTNESDLVDDIMNTNLDSDVLDDLPLTNNSEELNINTVSEFDTLKEIALTDDSNIEENMLEELPNDNQLIEDSNDLLDELPNLDADLFAELPEEKADMLEQLPESNEEVLEEEPVLEDDLLNDLPELSNTTDLLDSLVLPTNTDNLSALETLPEEIVAPVATKEELKEMKDELLENSLSKTLSGQLDIGFLDEPVVQKGRR